MRVQLAALLVYSIYRIVFGLLVLLMGAFAGLTMLMIGAAHIAFGSVATWQYRQAIPATRAKYGALLVTHAIALLWVWLSQSKSAARPPGRLEFGVHLSAASHSRSRYAESANRSSALLDRLAPQCGLMPTVLVCRGQGIVRTQKADHNRPFGGANPRGPSPLDFPQLRFSARNRLFQSLEELVTP